MLFVALLVFAALAAANPVPRISKLPGGNLTAGFENAHTVRSSGGKALCIAGLIPVTVTATNTKILIPEPQNQTAATELLVELFQANPTIYKTGNGGPSTFTDTYRISAKLCVPADPTAAANVRTVQVLTHGATLDQGYWDIPFPGLSYVEAAAAAGYATLAYSRLGVGGSSHPDPLQAMQVAVEYEVLHALVAQLRGGLGGQKWAKVVHVGHSFGCLVANGAIAKYPADFDAVVLTGATANVTYLPNVIEAFGLEVGAAHGLANGYLTPSSPMGRQFGLYRAPYFDPNGRKPLSPRQARVDLGADFVLVAAQQYAERQTITIGELFTVAGTLAPATAYTGPVDIVLGKYDFPFCGGDCTYPSDLAAAALPTLYPNADKEGSKNVILEQQGHCLNAHYSAPEAYEQIAEFLKANGL